MTSTEVTEDEVQNGIEQMVAGLRLLRADPEQDESAAAEVDNGRLEEEVDYLRSWIRQLRQHYDQCQVEHQQQRDRLEEETRSRIHQELAANAADRQEASRQAAILETGRGRRKISVPDPPDPYHFPGSGSV